MKTLSLFLIICGLCSKMTLAQNINNPSFDSIYIGGIDRVFEWITSDGLVLYANQNGDTVLPLTPHTIYDASGFQFSELTYQVGYETTPFSPVGIRLTNAPDLVKSTQDFFETFIVNGNQFKTDADGYLDFGSCGTPFPYRPTKLKGQYKFTDSLSPVQNYGKCMVLLKKYNAVTQSIDTIAFNYETTLFFDAASWTSFEIPLNYTSSAIPDSIVIAFFSSAYEQAETAIFTVDELSFEYGPLNIASIMQEEEPMVYPNPSQGVLFLDQIDETFLSYTLWSMDGTVLETAQIKPVLDLGKYESQLLILALKRADGTEKLVKIIRE